MTDPVQSIVICQKHKQKSFLIFQSGIHTFYFICTYTKQYLCNSISYPSENDATFRIGPPGTQYFRQNCVELIHSKIWREITTTAMCPCSSTIVLYLFLSQQPGQLSRQSMRLLISGSWVRAPRWAIHFCLNDFQNLLKFQTFLSLSKLK